MHTTVKMTDEQKREIACRIEARLKEIIPYHKIKIKQPLIIIENESK